MPEYIGTKGKAEFADFFTRGNQCVVNVLLLGLLFTSRLVRTAYSTCINYTALEEEFV